LEAFFKGVIPNLILVINPIINFVIYEGLKNVAIKKYGSERNIPFSSIFLMSSAGKIAATYATYPILTLKVKL
jgi:adenine nucleotide transporter 17